MTKLRYITFDALLQIKRNPTVTFTNLSLSLLFSILFNGLGRVYLVIAKAKLENHQQLDSSSLVGAQQQLIFFLTILQVLTAAALLIAALSGVFYYRSIFMKHFLAAKDNFAAMKYVGASSSYIALTFFLETWLIFLLGFTLATKLARLLYLTVANHASHLLRTYLIQPVYFKAAVELPLIAALTLLLITLTLTVRRKINAY